MNYKNTSCNRTHIHTKFIKIFTDDEIKKHFFMLQSGLDTHTYVLQNIHFIA